GGVRGEPALRPSPARSCDVGRAMPRQLRKIHGEHEEAEAGRQARTGRRGTARNVSAENGYGSGGVGVVELDSRTGLRMLGRSAGTNRLCARIEIAYRFVQVVLRAGDVAADAVVKLLDRRAQCPLVFLAEQVLAEQGLRVEVFQRDVGAELAAQVVGGIAGHLNQVAGHPNAVTDRLGKPVWTEDEHREQQENNHLPAVYPEEVHGGKATPRRPPISPALCGWIRPSCR